MKIFLEKILFGKTLTAIEAETAMEMLCSSDIAPEQKAAFLYAIHTRGESKDELLGFISFLRKQSILVNTDNLSVIDICGTGGDYSNTFNISTAAALLLASKGIRVAKHGGRAVSSLCGSADVLEALGIKPQENVGSAVNALKTQYFAFLLAPRFNPAYEKIRALRKTLGVRTCFNIIGPVVNPARVKRQIVGVYSKHLLKPLAEILRYFGSEEVMVIHSHDGTDEFSILAPTDVVHLKSGDISFYTITPAMLGFSYPINSSLQGGTSQVNAQIIRDVFSGVNKDQYRDAVILNAAAGFALTGEVKSLEEGIKLARENIENGIAHDFLNNIALGE